MILGAAKRHPWALGGFASAVYMFVAFPETLWMSALLLRASPVPPAMLVWGPNLLVLALSVILLDRNRSALHASAGR